ncbi:uncharacterized protein METZ01_LOCUS189505 [marine metagenome]|uniref:Uncharacterized protein n=1 Tax=marine metagenome TaxID=408172 RepID=A0A382DG39_9ZZZZ
MSMKYRESLDHDVCCTDESASRTLNDPSWWGQTATISFGRASSTSGSVRSQ